MSEMYASIPCCMTWDDHDIFDGWGSYPKDIQASEVYQGLYKYAEKYYCAFQLGCKVDSLPKHSTLPGKHNSKAQGYSMGNTAILNLDLRTERRKDQVMTEETYVALQQWLDAHTGFTHVIVVSSIPICYIHFNISEGILKRTGGEPLDDLLDHWKSSYHSKERKKFLNMLLDWAHLSKTRITIISGDVHIGAVGTIHHKKYLKKSNAGEINCLITSAVVNVPPPATAVHALSVKAGLVDHVDPSIRSALCKFGPRNRDYLIPSRNFLTAVGSDAGDIFCHWVTEGPGSDIETNNTLMISTFKLKGPDEKMIHPDQVIEGEGVFSSMAHEIHKHNKEVLGIGK